MLNRQPSFFSNVYVTRRFVTIGGRKTPEGFRKPLEKGFQVKQGKSEGVPRHIAGTTKVKYVNAKGRTFNFSIPLSEITHPPVMTQSASPTGWKHLDTSFCDLGELDEDMPSKVDEIIKKSVVVANDSEAEGEGGVVVEMDAAKLKELQEAFLEMCREYTLMSTDGMKTLLTYSELNNGPDYEMYDRKSVRTRLWLSIRHRYEDIKELLWPSAILDGDAVPDTSLVLSAQQMLDSLSWLEAASTFCPRRYYSYHYFPEHDFGPISLHREVQVLARRVQLENEGAQQWFLQCEYSNSEDSVLPNAQRRETAPLETLRTLSDRYITCAGLCLNHNCDFGLFLATSENDPTKKHSFLHNLPMITCVRDAIHVMFVANSSKDADALVFSDDKGNVLDSSKFNSLIALHSHHLFSNSDALQNVDEYELCTLMKFEVSLKEKNAEFFKKKEKPYVESIALIDRVTQLCVSRCKYLLYKFGGTQTVVMSGDEENIPFIQAQELSEKAHPDVLIHAKIGMENGQGLRFAFLDAKASAELVELLDRLGNLDDNLNHTAELVQGLVQHIAERTASGKNRFKLPDILRLLPLLSKLMLLSSETAVKKKYDRLFSVVGFSIASELQTDQPTENLVLLVEGLASCHFIPSSFRQIEMNILKNLLVDKTSITQLTRCFASMLQLVGVDQIPGALLQHGSQLILNELKTVLTTKNWPMLDPILDSLRVLRSCRYPGFESLLDEVFQQDSFPFENLQSPQSMCILATLLIYSSNSIEKNETVNKMRLNEGQTLLYEGLRTWVAIETPRDRDILTDSLLALELLPDITIEKTPDILRNLSHESFLHSFVSPLHAVYVLNSLESRDLVNEMYHHYEAYLDTVVSDLLLSSAALLEEDTSCLLQLLNLKKVKVELVKKAGNKIAHELKRLSIQFESSSDNSTEYSRSFETSQMHREHEMKTVGSRIFHLSCALAQNEHTRALIAELEKEDMSNEDSIYNERFA